MDERAVQGIVAGVLARHGSTETEIASLYAMRLGLSETGQSGMVAYTRTGTDKRVRTRVGRFVKAHFGEKRTDTDIQQIGAEIVASLWARDCVQELAGEDLGDFYLHTVSGIRSCMSCGAAQEYLNIYVDNPDVVRLATVRIGDQAGRALVWTFPNGQRFMDRVYSTGSNACVEALKDYASRNGIGLASQLHSSDTVVMKIRDGENSQWPYMDSMVYMTLLGHNSCQLSSRNGDYALLSTDGRLDDGGDICEGCGERLRRDDGFRGTDDDIYCESCYGERYTVCFYCGESTAIHAAHDVDEGGICTYCYGVYYRACEKCGEDVQQVSIVDGLCSDCAMSRMEEITTKVVEVVQADMVPAEEDRV